MTYIYDANGNNTSSSDGRTIAYTAYDKPDSIVMGNHETAFAYGPDRSRFERIDTVTTPADPGAGTAESKEASATLYLGGVERITRPDGKVEVRRPLGAFAIETRIYAAGNNPALESATLRYALRDHLGGTDELL